MVPQKFWPQTISKTPESHNFMKKSFVLNFASWVTRSLLLALRCGGEKLEDGKIEGSKVGVKSMSFPVSGFNSSDFFHRI